jgi:RimJ/RimL family protein N-acetyltransferase
MIADKLLARVTDDTPHGDRLRARHEVVADEDAAFNFIKDFIPIHPSFGQKGIVLRVDDEIIAALLYVEYNGSNVFCHIAGKPGRRWLNREFLFWAFSYPFDQLGCTRITGWVEEDNTDSRRFLENIGFVIEARLKGAGVHGQDVLLYRMLRSECRFLGRREKPEDRVRPADQPGYGANGADRQAGAGLH